MKIFTTLISAGALLLAQSASASPAVASMLQEYRAAGAGPFNAAAGERLWLEKYSHAEAPNERSCGSCHSNNLSDSGKHVKTHKPIKPMAPAVNNKRLTDSRQIEKWFMRNCKWTLGRECSPQEKGDFLLYIQKSGV